MRSRRTLARVYLNTASLADNSLKTYPLILTAITFPVTSWSEDLLIKQTIFFWLKSSVVNCLWLFNLTK